MTHKLLETAKAAGKGPLYNILLIIGLILSLLSLLAAAMTEDGIFGGIPMARVSAAFRRPYPTPRPRYQLLISK